VRFKSAALTLFAAAPVSLGSAVFGQPGPEVNPATLYEVTAPETAQKVKVGSKGKVVLFLKTKNDSHVSTEAPFKIEVTGKGLKPEKDRLALADAVEKRSVPEGVADPRFEIPFLATSAGPGAVEAKLTFFICTEKICARQQKTLAVPVLVE
jgi:hypothetical protein